MNPLETYPTKLDEKGRFSLLTIVEKITQIKSEIAILPGAAPRLGHLHYLLGFFHSLLQETALAELNSLHD